MMLRVSKEVNHLLAGQAIKVNDPTAAYKCSEGTHALELDGTLISFTSFEEWVIPTESVSALMHVAAITQAFQCACTVLIGVASAWRWFSVRGGDSIKATMSS